MKRTYPKANKQHNTDVESYFDFAYDHKNKTWRIEDFKSIGMTDEEIQSILNAHKKGWVIEKGEVYCRQEGYAEGGAFVFCCPKVLEEILIKYDLYNVLL